MTSVLYYSKLCDNCNEVLRLLSSHVKKPDIHFVCIDKRKVLNGETHIILNDNVTTIRLPSTIQMVPSLLLLNDKHKVLVGNKILEYIDPNIIFRDNPTKQDAAIDDPECFNTMDKWCDVSSDTYSFWDQSSDDLLAEGNGGMRQNKYFCGLDDVGRIYTPEDTYEPDKVAESDITRAKMERQTSY